MLEADTYDPAPVRYLGGHTHPDHNTLATFHIQFLDRQLAGELL